ncbi:hypothetical protein BS50DRAFT_279437 [Corynespora cassiicola Philippines]|uniref:Uncharacterized protein n=1 Tax=Corynespora cassiicola Philippines TaxID=1448308 RepID=A0A2T2P1N5_CORCC|nr:hypothetical protein BS50DRAFT_279437 [Corynespora cassiicola Philippines]
MRAARISALRDRRVCNAMQCGALQCGAPLSYVPPSLLRGGFWRCVYACGVFKDLIVGGRVDMGAGMAWHCERRWVYRRGTLADTLPLLWQETRTPVIILPHIDSPQKQIRERESKGVSLPYVTRLGPDPMSSSASLRAGRCFAPDTVPFMDRIVSFSARYQSSMPCNVGVGTWCAYGESRWRS